MSKRKLDDTQGRAHLLNSSDFVDGSNNLLPSLNASGDLQGFYSLGSSDPIAFLNSGGAMNNLQQSNDHSGQQPPQVVPGLPPLAPRASKPTQGVSLAPKSEPSLEPPRKIQRLEAPSNAQAQSVATLTGIPPNATARGPSNALGGTGITHNNIQDTGISALQKLAQGRHYTEIKAIEMSLKHIRANIMRGDGTGVDASLKTTRNQLTGILAELKTLETMHFLEPKDFKALETIREFIETYLIPQLTLYQGDVKYMVTNPPGQRRDSPVFLGLTQERAGPVFKEKPIGTFSLRLLTSARVSHITTGHVAPELIEAAQRIKRNNQELENSKQVFNETGIAVFNELKFNAGTFPNLVRMKFRVQVQVVIDGATITKNLESNASQPFISMTNTGSQWKDAAGSWLKDDAFKEKFEITVPCFWNYFQKHYLTATKQEVSNVKRPLFLTDFDYLLISKFGLGIKDKKNITQREFEKFWNWIGPGLKKIRYQKYLLWLFENGYLCAFVTGSDAERELEGHEAGTFIIRLSKRIEGEFVISYKLKTTVRHYLIQPDDTADKKKTLIDFLGQNRSFLHILQMRTSVDGKKVFYKHDKDEVLAKYYKKPPKQKAKNKALPQNPYDENVWSLDAQPAAPPARQVQRRKKKVN